MENSLTRKIYDRSPVFLQNVYASFFGWRKKRARYGSLFREWERRFRDSASLPLAELEAYQDEHLRDVIRHAYEHVPFYRERFAQAGLTPDDIKSVKDLPKLPLLEKDEIRQAGPSMLSDAYDIRRLMVHPTSGSTGQPMTLYTGPDALQIEYAFVWARRRPGVKRGDPYASFTGLQIVRPGAVRPPFWRRNWAANQTMYSVFHMSDANLAHYVRNLNRKPLAYMEGYPAPIYLIAEYIRRTGEKFSNFPKAVYSTSEELQPQYRETIESVLHTKVWDMYGQGEFVASISEYACGHMHYDMDYGIIEFLDQGREGDLIKAEVVCTGLYNYAWPLIRYRVGDMVLYDPNEQLSPNCGHAGRIIKKVLGRTGQFFTLPDGTRVTNISVIAKKCRNIVTLQVLQEQAGSIELLVQKAPGYSADDEKLMREMFANKVGEIPMKISYVDKPLLTARGKFLSIISKVQPAQQDPVS